MKIVCDVCQAKYSIADEKIQGKAFKIRCKKCNHIIVVRTTGEVTTVPPGGSADKQKSAPAAAPAAAEQGVWHVVVDGEQVGPITESEVKEKLRIEQLTGESLVWKEGFADWTALAAVQELAALQPRRPSSSRAAVNEPVRASATLSTASPSPDAGDVFGAATVVTQPSTDLFAAAAAAPQAVPNPVAPAPSSPFLFGGIPVQEPAVVIKNPSNGAGGTQLTGQRNENSVLFSLSNLEALAVSSPASPGIRVPSATSSTEGSGLIDIRSMAAMTLNDGSDGRRSSEALPTFSSPQFSPVAPVLLPISSSGPPRWVYPVLGLLAVGILVLGYGIYRVMGSPPPGTPIIIQQVVAPQPQLPPPASAAPVAAPAPAPAPEAAKAAPSEEKPVASGEEKGSEKAKSSSGKGDKGHRKSEGSSRSDAKRSSESAISSGDSSSSKGKGKGKGKEIGDLASEFGKKAPEETPKPAPPQVKLVTLTQSDIVNAMKGVQPKVQACANQFKVPGTAMANIGVAAGGKVTNAKVTGKFAGSPTGTCVENAARSAKFPACQGMNFPWPFTLMPH